MNDLTAADALGLLLDRQAIWDCMIRYARGVDRLDADLVGSAFWPDAHDSHGFVNGTPAEFLAAWLPTQPVREAAQHTISNQSVWFDGGEAADTETYFMSAAKQYGSTTMELVAGRYVDRFEKRAGEWRIKTRLVLLDWQCTADASAMADRLSRSYAGARGPADPSYERPVRPRFGVPEPAVPPASGQARA